MGAGRSATGKYPPEQVFEGRDGSRLAAVILVAVDVQHPFAADGEHAREDALLQAGAEDDCVVLLIHVRAGQEAGRKQTGEIGARVLRSVARLERQVYRSLSRVPLPRGSFAQTFLCLSRAS